jgi:hypothetical protein
MGIAWHVLVDICRVELKHDLYIGLDPGSRSHTDVMPQNALFWCSKEPVTSERRTQATACVNTFQFVAWVWDVVFDVARATIGRLGAGLSPRRSVFDPTPVQAGLCVQTKWHCDRFFSQYFCFSCITPPMLHTHSFICHRRYVILTTNSVVK